MNGKVVVLACLLVACSSSYEAAGPGGNGPDSGTGSDVADARPGSDPADAGRGSEQLPACTIPGRAIVTDIDATLTTSDNEWITQLLVGTHVPAEREGGAAMISAYADRGYYVVYLTARPEAAPIVVTGQTAAEATMQWLVDHGYPVDPERSRLVLAPGLVFGASAADYKGQALLDMQAEGFTFAFAYGNATSDIEGYEAAGIPKESTFIIGPEAGTSGTVAVPSEDWVQHAAAFVDRVPATCEWR